jgi:hypothetical protein
MADRLPRPPLFRCRGGLAWHLISRIREIKWSEREDCENSLWPVFVLRARIAWRAKPACAPKSPAGDLLNLTFVWAGKKWSEREAAKAPSNSVYSCPPLFSKWLYLFVNLIFLSMNILPRLLESCRQLGEELWVRELSTDFQQ